MKKLFNISTYSDDLARFEDREDFLSFSEDFDGVELLCGGDDPLGIIPEEKILGAHSVFFNYWYDLWTGDTDSLIRNLGSEENIAKYYGTADRNILTETLRNSIRQAGELGAGYCVVHISDCAPEEAFTRRYKRTDREIADAMCDIIHEACEGLKAPKILAENLWVPGMTLRDPGMVKRVLDNLSDLDAGIMLDTGHIMNSDMNIRNIDEACDCIEEILRINRENIDRIEGVHLSQSLSGEYARAHMQGVFDGCSSFEDRNMALFEYISNLDQHVPFASRRVRDILSGIGPQHVTFEFITRTREELGEKLQEQLRWLYS